MTESVEKASYLFQIDETLFSPATTTSYVDGSDAVVPQSCLPRTAAGIKDSEKTSALPPLTPSLPHEITVLIVSYCIEPYSIKIAYSWWNFECRFRIYNIPRAENLQLISRSFNHAVNYEVRRAFTGQMILDYANIQRMQHYRRSRSTLVNWLFDHTKKLIIPDYDMCPGRNFHMGLKHWPALRCLLLRDHKTLGQLLSRAFLTSGNLSPADLELFLATATRSFVWLCLRDEPSRLRVFIVLLNEDYGLEIGAVERTEKGAAFTENWKDVFDQDW